MKRLFQSSLLLVVARTSLCLCILLVSWHFSPTESLVSQQQQQHHGLLAMKLHIPPQQASSFVLSCANRARQRHGVRIKVKPKDDNDNFVYDNNNDDDVLEGDLNGQVDYEKFQPFFDDDETDIDDNDDDSDPVDYEKYQARSKLYQEEEEEEEEEEESLSPLPEYLNDNHAHVPQQSTIAVDDLQQRMQEQQRQIDMIISLIQQPQQQPQQQQSHQEPPPEMLSHAVTPLKAMLFIDGTWLYYSVHERDEQKCPIVRKYGRGWQNRYQLDWAALPRVISEQLQLQETRQVEIARSSVYTSCKKDTSRKSNRIKMFQEMQNANYDVFMMETVGPGEKCVDIQLAVEMLHYATVVPEAYDVAILLSGDKDFLPALIRTRQKGRKVAIVAFRAGCNRALYETPNVKDYDVVWMDDFLDRLVVPKVNLRSSSSSSSSSHMSIFTISKVIHDFIQKSGLPRVSSRDIGRYLKLQTLNQRSLLNELKQTYGGLYQFLTVSPCFDVEKRNHQDEKAWQKIDPNDRTFWAALHEDSELLLLEEAKMTHFTPQEKEFFDTYSLQQLYDDPAVYFHSREALGSDELEEPMIIPPELKRDFSKCKVAELKEICRERGLLLSGTKVALMERIQQDVDNQVLELQRQHSSSPKTRMKRPSIAGRINGDHRRQRVPATVASTGTEKYLEGLIQEYIQARGGKASSRDIGRYLAANSSSGQTESCKTALIELKSLYGGLSAFLSNRPDSFQLINDDSTDTAVYEFLVALKQ